MPTAINAVNCKKFVLGTGLVDCEPFFGQPTSALLVKKSWQLAVDDSDTFDLDYIVARVQDGTFVPFLSAKGFTENTPDPTRQDYPQGQRRTIRNGNPDYTFEFDNGLGFHKASYSYNGSSWNVILFDQVGNAMLQSNVAGTILTGFSASDINTRTYRQAAGDTAAATMLEIQLANPEEFNRQMTLINVADINANINTELRGVISVNINIVSASAASGVVVDVTSVNNSIYGIEALLLGNFEMHNITDDVVSNISTAVASGTVAGRYTLTPTTPPSNGDVIQVATKGYSLGNATLLVGSTQLYKGISTEFTATA